VQFGGAVGGAGFLVELVRELMDDHIAARLGMRRVGQHVLPGEDHLALRPGFARQHLAHVLQDAGTVGMGPVDHKRAGIDQDLAQVGVIRIRAVQQWQTGLRRDGQPDAVVDHQAGATDEGLFGKEHLDVALELQLQVGRQALQQGHTLLQDAPPGGRERGLAQAGAAPARPPGLQQPRRHQQQGCDQKEEKGHGHAGRLVRW
jgi:hypothetical protein